MDKYNYFKKGGVRPSDEQLLDTKLFYTHSVEIFSAHKEKYVFRRRYSVV